MHTIIPKPKNISIKEGYLCIKPTYSTDCAEFKRVLHAFAQNTDKMWGLSVLPGDIKVNEALFTPLTEAAKDTSHNAQDDNSKYVAKEDEERVESGFLVKKDKHLRPGEYKIIIDKTCAIYAGDCEGLNCALASLLQFAGRTCDKYIKIPKCVIIDRPDSYWRSLMLDVARQWHPVDYLYRYVDVCHLLKINRLVIHFTDDESFTLPIDSFPDLATENRCYTKAELTALEEYAFERGVMIVPEVDMPGHCAQFMHKYPDTFGRCGIMRASDETFAALEKLYSDVAALFPHSEYIHIGGDEAVLNRWSTSEKTLQYMYEHHLEDFVALHGHFISRIAQYILSIGKVPVIWEGFRKEENHMIPKEALIIAWESYYQLAPDLLADGFTVINASWKPLYCLAPWQFWSQEEILQWNKYSWDHWWEGSIASKERIKGDTESSVCGGMLCAWGDYLKNYESCRLASTLEIAAIIPRLAALSERVWNDKGGHDLESFNEAYAHFEKIVNNNFERNAFRGRL